MNTQTKSREEEIAAARAADVQIAAAWTAYYAEADKVARINASIESTRKFAKWSGRSEDETLAKYETRLTAATEIAQAARTAAVELDEALYTGWTRFYLVKHIHSSQHCSSFRWNTQIGWLPNLSGQTEAEAVAEHGAILCTICFPSAPLEYTRGVQDDRCAGSGKSIYNGLESRTGYYSGNWATCEDCGAHVGVSRNGLRVPKHQAKASA